MDGFVVALRGTSSVGKTQTLNGLIRGVLELPPSTRNVLYQSWPENTALDDISDHRLVVNVQGVTILINTMGDEVDPKLDELKTKYKCSLIFCACRTSGSTYSMVVELSARYNFGLVLASTYNTQVLAIQPGVNRLKSKQLWELACSLIPQINQGDVK